MLPKFDREKALFAGVAFIFLIGIAGISVYGFVYRPVVVLEALSVALFFAYSICYVLRSGNADGYSFLRIPMLCMFFAVLAVFALQVSYVLLVIGANFYSIASEPTLVFAEIPALLPVILLVFFARYLGSLRLSKNGKRNARILSYIFVIFAVLFVIAVYMSGALGNKVSLDDEEFLTVMAAHSLATGHNPYAVSFQAQLYNYSLTKNFSAGLTYTTNNLFESGVDYPALSFLVFVPFSALSGYGINVLITFFTLLAVAVVALVVEPGALRRPPVIMLVFLLAFFALYASVIDFLMLAIVLLAYRFLDSKYLWILLGIAASLQEQLWIVVLLMLLYVFRNMGVRKGSLNLLGTLAVFLLINGYFIISGPSLFASQVLAPASGYILPDPSAPFGFAVLTMYGTLLGAETVLFAAAVLLSAVLLLWLNDRRLIFLLALLPFTFLYHAILPYYTFFLAALMVSLYVKRAKRSAVLPGALATGTALSCIAAIALASILLVAVSHMAYSAQGISVGAQVLGRPQASNTIYRAQLRYQSNSLGQLVLQEFVMYNGSAVPVSYGTQGFRILDKPYYNLSGEGLSYRINPNRILLGSAPGSANLSVSIPSNSSTAVASAECALYYGGYYYICPPARAQR